MFDKEQVVWIGDTGYDNGGSATLGIYFAKIFGITTLFRCKESKDKGVLAYQDLKGLKQLLDNIQPKVILLFPFMMNQPINNKMKAFFELIFSYQKSIGSKIVLIDCTRNGILLGKRDCDEVVQQFEVVCPGTFDCLWSITGETREKWSRFTKEYRLVDFNLYQLENKPIEHREKSVGYASRVCAFKGVNRLMNNILEYICQEQAKKNIEDKQSLPFIHIGGDHSVKDWNNRGIISGSIGTVNLFAKSTSDKTPKDGFSIKGSIQETLSPGLYNIYPRFNFHEKEEVFSKIGIAICPSLARVKPKESTSTTLDKDDKYIEKNKVRWQLAMEYVNYEFIEYGIPLMFSRDFCLAYDPTMLDLFPELIYDNLEDCLVYCQENYDSILKNAYKQRVWLESKLKEVCSGVEQEIERLL